MRGARYVRPASPSSAARAIFASFAGRSRAGDPWFAGRSATMSAHSIHAAGGDHAHAVWDNSIEPVLEVEPGAEITLEALDASGGQLDAGSQASDVAGLDFARVNP